MGEEYLAAPTKTCRDCGQLVDMDRHAEGGEPLAGNDQTDLDWSEFCPSPNCPIKAEQLP